MALLTVAAAFGLALIHLLAGKLRFLGGVPRSIWLSAAGGSSVSYVFLHLLPELAEGQEVIQEAAAGALAIVERHAYLVALAGLVIFYGLERAAKLSHQKNREVTQGKESGLAVFWIHIASFSLYNVLVGYLLVHNSHSAQGLTFFFIAMALHFLVNDFGLQSHYEKIYATKGRWLLAVAVLVGWGAGMTVEIPEWMTSLFIAFLAGGIVLNVLKEELPEERESRFGAFLAGAAGYAVLLLAL